MREHLVTHLLEELVFRLEMRIESAPSDIGFIDDLLHRYIFKTPLSQQLCKRIVYRRPGLLLSSVHLLLPYIFAEMFNN
jgi:hypothetical protein